MPLYSHTNNFQKKSFALLVLKVRVAWKLGNGVLVIGYRFTWSWFFGAGKWALRLRFLRQHIQLRSVLFLNSFTKEKLIIKLSFIILKEHLQYCRDYANCKMKVMGQLRCIGSVEIEKGVTNGLCEHSRVCMLSTATFLWARAEIKNLLCVLASNAKTWGARASEHSFKFCEQIEQR